jgi:L-aminopeptidase/D-esterase-like protein
MPSRKRSRTPPAAPAPAPAAPVPAVASVPSLRETFEPRHFLAAGLIVLASVPALLLAVWNAPGHSSPVVVLAVIALAAGAWIFDREQWMAESRRQMLLTMGFVALALATAPAVPIGLLIPTLCATVLEFKRGWGAASALILGAGVAYAIFGVNPVTSYPYVLGMAWPAVGANVMRRIALAGSGHGPTTVLGRGRW